MTLGLLITLELWWTYFHRFAATAEERLRTHGDPVLAAADAYCYLHLVLVAGIIVFAVGVKVAVRDVGEPLDAASRLVLTGGVAAYLAGHVAFRLRLVGAVSGAKLAAAAGALAVFALGGGLPAWAVAAVLAAVLGALCGYEALLTRAPG